jgi:hypothetical protein
MSRFRFIAAEKASSSVVQLCRVLGVSTSGFYAWQHRQPSRRAREDAELLERIRAVHANSHCTYGAPRVHAELRATGRCVGKKRIARLMRAAGVAGRCPKQFKRTTIPAVAPAAQPPDLVRRDFNPNGPDHVWVADITYVRTWEGWLYLAVILDAFSRRVVGWSLADHLRTELATNALHMALATRRPPRGLIHHSDRGGQYFERRLHRPTRRTRRRLERRSTGHMLGQCRARELLRHAQDRASLPRHVADPAASQKRDISLLGELLQPPATTFQARLPQPSRLRGRPPCRYSSCLINPSTGAGQDQFGRLRLHACPVGLRIGSGPWLTPVLAAKRTQKARRQPSQPF